MQSQLESKQRWRQTMPRTQRLQEEQRRAQKALARPKPQQSQQLRGLEAEAQRHVWSGVAVRLR